MRQPLLLYREISSLLSPSDLYSMIEGEPYPFLIELSGEGGTGGSYSYLGASPFLTIQSSGGVTKIKTGGKVAESKAPPLDVLRKYLDRYLIALEQPLGLPFTGGAVGFVAPSGGQAGKDGVELFFAFYDSILCHRAGDKHYTAIAVDFPGEGSATSREDVEKNLEKLTERVSEHRFESKPLNVLARKSAATLVAIPDYQEFTTSARSVFESGPALEFAIPHTVFRAPAVAPPSVIYKKLAMCNPASFAAILQYPGYSLMTSTPEIAIRFENKRLYSRLAGGRRPKSRDKAADEHMRNNLSGNEFLADVLNRFAEVRADEIRPFAREGSMTTTAPHIEENHPLRYYLSVDVEASADKFDAVSALAAGIPWVAATGLPKKTAAHAVSAIERSALRLSGGAIGYFSFTGECNFAAPTETIYYDGRSVAYGAPVLIARDSDVSKAFERARGHATDLFARIGFLKVSGE